MQEICGACRQPGRRHAERQRVKIYYSSTGTYRSGVVHSTVQAYAKACLIMLPSALPGGTGIQVPLSHPQEHRGPHITAGVLLLGLAPGGDRRITLTSTCHAPACSRLVLSAGRCLSLGWWRRQPGSMG